MDSSDETPKLSLFSIRTKKASPEHPWMVTPPHRNFLSVPFRWEEEPGKPLPCLALATIDPTETTPKSLELPPRLLFSDQAKLPSPTTVLDGPYMGRQRFQSSSFRSEKGSYSSSPSGSLGALVVSNRRERGFKGKGLFGSLLVKGSGRNNKESSGGSFVFPSSSENRESDDMSSVGSEKVKIARIRRGGSFSSHPNHPTSHFWGTIYEGFKRAVPWRSKKWNRVI